MSYIKCLDGNLFQWISHLQLLNKFEESGLFRNSHDFLSVHEDISRMLAFARASGYHWVWTFDDIIVEEKITKGEYLYKLPPVDLAAHFKLEGGNNNLLPKFAKEHKVLKTVQWDTEFSTWYPLFSSRDGALQCIREIDELLDKRYFKPKKKS